jgi:hypothetical protein
MRPGDGRRMDRMWIARGRDWGPLGPLPPAGALLQDRSMDGEHTRPDPLFFPVRASQPGMICLRTGHLASGLPIGLAFTSEASLQSVLGPRQQWTLICERALLDMLAPLGIHHLRIDPMLALGTPPDVPEGTASPAARPGGPLRADTPRVPSPRPGVHPASRRRHGKHRCDEHSVRRRSHRRTLTGCAVHRWPGSVPTSAPAQA